VGRQGFLVDPGAVIEALGVAQGYEPHEVVVALAVRGEEREMVVGLFDSRPRLVVAAPRSHVDLAPEDRLQPTLAACVVEGDRSEHVAVIRHGHRLHSQPDALLHEFLDAARPVEEAVLGMQVQVDELRHLP
jgi:hypothetical protein